MLCVGVNVVVVVLLVVTVGSGWLIVGWGVTVLITLAVPNRDGITCGAVTLIGTNCNVEDTPLVGG